MAPRKLRRRRFVLHPQQQVSQSAFHETLSAMATEFRMLRMTLRLSQQSQCHQLVWTRELENLEDRYLNALKARLRP